MDPRVVAAIDPQRRRFLSLCQTMVLSSAVVTTVLQPYLPSVVSLVVPPVSIDLRYHPRRLTGRKRCLRTALEVVCCCYEMLGSE